MLCHDTLSALLAQSKVISLLMFSYFEICIVQLRSCGQSGFSRLHVSTVCISDVSVLWSSPIRVGGLTDSRTRFFIMKSLLMLLFFKLSRALRLFAHLIEQLL